jgi:electron transfer flavoprotein beta subunit
VTYVKSLDIEDGLLIAGRVVEDGVEKIRAPLPALVTVLGEVSAPRYPRIPNLLAACDPKAKIKVLNAADIGARADMTGLAGSYTRVIETFSPKVTRGKP